MEETKETVKRKPGRPRKTEEAPPPQEPISVSYTMDGGISEEFRCSKWYEAAESYIFQSVSKAFQIETRMIRKASLLRLKVTEPPQFFNQSFGGGGSAFPVGVAAGSPPSKPQASPVSAGPPPGSYNAQAVAKAHLVSRMTENGPMSTVEGEHGIEVVPVGFFSGEPPS